MAEESDLEKTEPASPRRLEKAHEEGQIARSRELVTFVMLSTGLGCLWVTGDMMSSHLGSALRNGLQFERAAAFDASQMLVQSASVVLHALQALVPLLAAMLVAALVAPMLLVHALLPVLGTHAPASVVVVGSTFGSLAFPGFAAYSASKSGLRGLTEALAREYADTPLRFQYLSPRAARTPFNTPA